MPPRKIFSFRQITFNSTRNIQVFGQPNRKMRPGRPESVRDPLRHPLNTAHLRPGLQFARLLQMRRRLFDLIWPVPTDVDYIAGSTFMQSRTPVLSGHASPTLLRPVALPRARVARLHKKLTSLDATRPPRLRRHPRVKRSPRRIENIGNLSTGRAQSPIAMFWTVPTWRRRCEARKSRPTDYAK